MGTVVTLAEYRDLANALYETLRPAAIVGAGIWTYLTFIRGRPKIARAKMCVAVTVLDQSGDKTFVRVKVSLENTGPKRIRLRDAKVDLTRIRPLPREIAEAVGKGKSPTVHDGQFGWTTIERQVDDFKSTTDVECGQIEQLSFDFCLGPEIERFIVYAFFENATKKGAGWSSSTEWEFVTVGGRKRVVRLDDSLVPADKVPFGSSPEGSSVEKEKMVTLPIEVDVGADQKMRPSLPEPRPLRPTTERTLPATERKDQPQRPSVAEPPAPPPSTTPTQQPRKDRQS
jgi:hypothetical protein